ncbi:iron chaperone [Streptomyces sp. NPDC058664]|uniref:iron chaperone n=1 Tax=unclassified Streptomyces TaxID=2593676 RepID=UPI00364736C2
MSTRTSTENSGTSTSGEKYDGFTEEERDAMKERAKELKAAARRDARTAKARADGETEVRAKIAEMPDADRVLAERLHEIVAASAPGLVPKLWYGMPSYADADGKVVCFFQSAQKFKTRYATLGFSDLARLDDGAMWATSYALTELGAADEARIAALIEKAAG